MVRRSFLATLALCLVLSACGGMVHPVPSIPEESSQAESAPLAASSGTEAAFAPPPARSESSTQVDPRPESSSASRGSQEPPEPVSQAPEESKTESSRSVPPPVQSSGGGEGEVSRVEEPSSKVEVEPEPPAVSEPSGDGESASSQEPAPEESQAESCPEPPSAPEVPEALPQGCRWMNITEVSVLGFINRERGKQGLTPLTLDKDLTAAARVRAEELYRGNYIAHTRPGGEPWETVLGEIPVDYARAAENLAWCNHGTGEEIGAFQWFSFWRESPSHYKAMMDEMYTHCGVAVLTGPYYDGEDQSYAVAVFCTY